MSLAIYADPENKSQILNKYLVEHGPEALLTPILIFLVKQIQSEALL